MNEEKILNEHNMFSCAAPRFINMSDINDTCYRKNDLEKIANAINDIYGEGTLKNINAKSSQELWDDINSFLGKKCNSEDCLLYQKDILAIIPQKNKISLLKETFKPPRPMKNGKYKGVWLSDTDISNVMEQYEKVYKNFKFLGPYPIDWVNYVFYNFVPHQDIATCVKNGYNQIGIMFNTGTLASGGIHWVATFIDFKNKTYNGKYTIEYFDSVGNPPAQEFMKAIENIYGERCKSLNKCDCTIIHKHVKQLNHQKGNSECGVYCLYFITERLKGRTYVDIQSNLKDDLIMDQYRSKFFRWIKT